MCMGVGLKLFTFCICVISNHIHLLFGQKEISSLATQVHSRVVTVSILCLFLAVPLFGLQCVIVVFPYYIYLLFWFGLYKSVRSRKASLRCVLEQDTLILA